jgi:hypothetical protein
MEEAKQMKMQIPLPGYNLGSTLSPFGVKTPKREGV